MKKKAVLEIAEAIDKKYGNDAIGTEISTVLVEEIKAGGYTDPIEIDMTKKLVWEEVKNLRKLGRAS